MSRSSKWLSTCCQIIFYSVSHYTLVRDNGGNYSLRVYCLFVDLREVFMFFQSLVGGQFQWFAETTMPSTGANFMVYVFNTAVYMILDPFALFMILQESTLNDSRAVIFKSSVNGYAGVWCPENLSV